LSQRPRIIGWARGRDCLGFEPELSQHVEQHRADIGDADVLRADRGMPDVVHRPPDEGLLVPLDMVEDAPEIVVDEKGGGHGVVHGGGTLRLKPASAG
jgi:hypothetical protein